MLNIAVEGRARTSFECKYYRRNVVAPVTLDNRAALNDSFLPGNVYAVVFNGMFRRAFYRRADDTPGRE